MTDDQLTSVLAALSDQHKEMIAAIRDKPERSKDFWDKFSSASTFLSGVVVALVGLYFTTTYNAQQARREEGAKAEQLRVAQVELVHKFIPELTGTEKQKKLAIVALSALGNAELATKLAVLDQSEGSKAALESLVQSGDPIEKSLAERALRNYRNYESYFSDIQGGSTVGRAALSNAIEELKSGVWEEGGSGRGPRIKKYSAAVGMKEGIPWSAAFVSWCFSQARNPPPFKTTAAWMILRAEFKASGWLHEENSYIPQPGDVMFIRFRSSDPGGYKMAGHGGIVFHYENGRVDAIEGNASDDPRLPGFMVVARTRLTHSTDNTEVAFGHVPD